MNERDLFIAALQIEDPAARSAYLGKACGDDADLRQRVEALLAAFGQAGSFLQQRAADPAATSDVPPAGPSLSSAPAEGPGAVIGPYKLLQQIGEGGMGTVFLAEQTHPVQRKVALKLIKAGMDSRQVIARFEAERQALALMDHPNIAKVLDAGTTAPIADLRLQIADLKSEISNLQSAISPGRPYFVMELVKGVPITKYCDEHHLTPRQRLELFVPVCQAVQHAHQKGIIHRDLKPSNVMVCLYDGKPVPKVIDFGIAKATGARLTEKTLFTELGQVVGTLEYMSPEQAELNQLDIDTRSDIYSLGVLLYELLTGTTPLSRERLKQAAFLEVLRMIREEEPPRPSTRLSTAEGLPSIAANRGVEPKKLSGLMRGELDWIVMKTLEKDRNRRYETANGLAADVLRYVNDEAVQACPPSTAYRLKKFLRRNKVPMVVASLVLLTLVGGIIGTTLGLLRAQDEAIKAGQERDRAKEARDAERKAKEAEKSQRKLAEAARADEKRHRIRAEGDRDRAAATLDAMTSSVVGDALTQQKALTREQKQFLITALTYYREVLKEKANAEAGKKRLAAAAFRVGLIENRLGRRREAAVVLRQARDLYTQLTDQFPAVLEYREARAKSHDELAASLSELGTWGEAETELRAALAIRRKLVAEFPKIPKYRRELASCHFGMGARLFGMRKWEQAAAEYRAAIDIEKQLVAEFPRVPWYARNLADSRDGLATMLQAMNQWDQAETEYRAALETQKELVATFPGDRSCRRAVAQTHMNLAGMLLRLRKWDLADTELRRALDVGKKLLTEFPGEHSHAELVGTTLHNLGIVAVYKGRPNDALAWFDQAITTLSPVVDREPGLAGSRQVLRNSHSSRALALDGLKRFDEAAIHWEKAMKLSQGRDRTYRHSLLMLSRLHAGQLEPAMKDADELAKIGAKDLVYDCACIYALAHAKTKDDKHAARAVELLRQAVAKGFRDVTHLKKDADLESLRARADFRQVLAGLEKKKAPKVAPMD